MLAIICRSWARSAEAEAGARIRSLAKIRQRKLEVIREAKLKIIVLDVAILRTAIVAVIRDWPTRCRRDGKVCKTLVGADPRQA
jgi:hypothetical protein